MLACFTSSGLCPLQVGQRGELPTLASQASVGQAQAMWQGATSWRSTWQLVCRHSSQFQVSMLLDTGGAYCCCCHTQLCACTSKACRRAQSHLQHPMWATVEAFVSCLSRAACPDRAQDLAQLVVCVRQLAVVLLLQAVPFYDKSRRMVLPWGLR